MNLNSVQLGKTILDNFKNTNEISYIGYFGIFGSSIYTNDCQDIDMLLITKDKCRKYSDNEQKLMDIVTLRMHGNYGKNNRDPMPRDNSHGPAIYNILDTFSYINKIEIDYGIGPSSLHERCSQWIHFNGPMTSSLWNLFSVRFPIHSRGILSNTIDLYGTIPKHPIVQHEDICKYAEDMNIRRKNLGLSPSYIRKLIKGISLILGQNSCDFESCLTFLIKVGILNKSTSYDSIDNLSTRELDQAAIHLISAIRNMSHINPPQN